MPLDKKEVEAYIKSIGGVTPRSLGQAAGQIATVPVEGFKKFVTGVGTVAKKGVEIGQEVEKGIAEGFTGVTEQNRPRTFVQMPSLQQAPAPSGAITKPVIEPSAQPAAPAQIGTPARIGGSGGGRALGGGGAPQFLNTVASNRKALEDAGFVQVIRGLNSRLESPAFSKYGSQSIDESMLQPGGFVGQERMSRAGGSPQVAAQELASQAKLGAASIGAGARQAAASTAAEAAKETAKLKAKPLSSADAVTEALNQAIIAKNTAESPEEMAIADADVQRLMSIQQQMVRSPFK